MLVLTDLVVSRLVRHVHREVVFGDFREGERKDSNKLVARKKFDSIDDLDELSPDELARRTALNVHWMRKDAEDIKSRINNLVPEAVCDARSKAITAEVKALTGKVPPVVKSTVEEVTGITALAKLLTEQKENGTGAVSGLSWVKNNPKLTLSILSLVVGLSITGVVKVAYFIVDMDKARKEREVQTNAAIKNVEKKIEPNIRTIVVPMPAVVPDAGAVPRYIRRRIPRRRIPRRDRSR
jgi:hypothetical protein